MILALLEESDLMIPDEIVEAIIMKVIVVFKMDLPRS